MSVDNRRIFPMETVLALFAGQNSSAVVDMLSFAIGREFDEACMPAVGPLVQGWLASLHPPLLGIEYDGSVSFTVWAVEEEKKLGNNVSLPPIPESQCKGMYALLDLLIALREDVEEKEQAIEDSAKALSEVEKSLKELTPFKTQAEELVQKNATLEEKNKALAHEVDGLKKDLAAFEGKLAINAGDIEKTIKDIVVKAVSSIGTAVGTGAAGGVESDEAAADVPSQESSVPDNFGFGTSGADGDGFGF